MQYTAICAILWPGTAYMELSKHIETLQLRSILCAFYIIHFCLKIFFNRDSECVRSSLNLRFHIKFIRALFTISSKYIVPPTAIDRQTLSCSASVIPLRESLYANDARRARQPYLIPRIKINFAIPLRVYLMFQSFQRGNWQRYQNQI